MIGPYIRFRPAFTEAMDQRLYPIAYLDHLLFTEQAKLWCSDTAAIVAELKRFPSGAVAVHGLVAAGDLEGIKALIPQAEEWGRQNGAIGALIDSRDGWGRALKHDGYAPFQTALWKELA